jgi:multiple sugar transport system permease protein
MTSTAANAKQTGRGESGAATLVVAPPTHPRKFRKIRSTQWAAWAFLAPVIIYLGVFYGWPLYRNVELSLHAYTVQSFVSGGAPFVWFQNYVNVFQSPTFGPAATNTALFVGLSIVFQFVIGMALAVFFFQHFRLSSVLRALFLVPWLLPLIVSASTWAWLLNSDSGLVNSILHGVGLGQINWLTSPQWSLVSVLIANIWIGIPFNLVIIYSGLQNISQDLYEAASLDGANGWQKFWRITFPLLRPVSAIVILLGLIYTLKVFDIIWIMTKGGPGDSSNTFATWSYRLGFGSVLPDFSSAATVANLLIIVALILGFIYLRFQRRGVNS